MYLICKNLLDKFIPFQDTFLNKLIMIAYSLPNIKWEGHAQKLNVSLSDSIVASFKLKLIAELREKNDLVIFNNYKQLIESKEKVKCY